MQLSEGTKRTWVWLGIALMLAWVLWLLGPVLTPFLVAAVMAYALAPMVAYLQAATKGRVPKALIVVLVEVVFLSLAVGIVLLVIPILTKELPLLREQVPVLFQKINDSMQPLLAQLGLKTTLDVSAIKTFVLKYLNANGEEALAQVFASLKIGGSVAITILSNALLIPMALFYFLMDWDRVVVRTLRWVPPRFRSAVDDFTHEISVVLGHYVRGQLLVMGLLAVYYSAGLFAFGLDLAMPIGVFTGMAIFVPYLGFGVGLVLALLAGLLQFASLKALVMVGVVYGIGQLIESFYLTPKLVGESIGMHPLVVIFALLAFGQLLGFIGVLIALPTSAVLAVAFGRGKAAYRASALYTGGTSPSAQV